MTSTYTAMIQQNDGWWIGWIEEVPGVLDGVEPDVGGLGIVIEDNPLARVVADPPFGTEKGARLVALADEAVVEIPGGGAIARPAGQFPGRHCRSGRA